MRALLIVAAAAVGLSACTTTDTSKINTAIQKNLPKTCSAIETAHIAFAAVAATGKIKDSTVRKEAAAYQGIQIVCDDPGNATAASTLIAAAQAYLVISTALKEAKAAAE
ncbi:cell wall anchor protein [Rhizobium mesosinicum]|uniref:Cell wall anchor protein n=1 Tax=Rhizobium mesosinicum TaxID=335017 RepID=A0ABS7GU39_9HYPH|nr:cell wall anchor protein [Rhizobium mesosinicum]MBW9053468.1 cell wall anchor protein [Rhizobium mesosinicum]